MTAAAAAVRVNRMSRNGVTTITPIMSPTKARRAACKKSCAGKNAGPQQDENVPDRHKRDADDGGNHQHKQRAA